MIPESVWDYPRPPRLESVPQEIRIVLAGRTIARTREAKRVLETSHPPVYYLPRASFACAIEPARQTSFCEWKGRAAYWSLRERDHFAQDCAWSYPDPIAAFAAIRDHLAVYPQAMDACFVGDEQVRRSRAASTAAGSPATSWAPSRALLERWAGRRIGETSLAQASGLDAAEPAWPQLGHCEGVAPWPILRADPPAETPH